MIIGLTGYAQSGKDSVANVLTKNYGFQRIAFADKIRDLLYEMNPDFKDTLLQQAVNKNGWDEVKQDPSVRRMLQNLGVGARKVFGENHWIVEALKNIDRDANYVITDVRFINEAEWVKEVYSGQLWRIKRTGVEAVNGHVSEHELDGYKVDQILSNGGTLEELELLVHNRMDVLLANQIT